MSSTPVWQSEWWPDAMRPPATLIHARAMLDRLFLNEAAEVAPSPSHHHRHAWLGWLTRPFTESRPVKSLVGYKRLKALKPMPWPIQDVIDRVLIPSWLGTGDEAVRNLIRNLPFIGDALLEGDLLQAAFANALSSVKMLVLLASVIKAARMRRRLRAVRRNAAARIIFNFLRRASALSRVARLRHKHERAAHAVDALSRMRSKPAGGGWGWSGMSLPDDMSKIGRSSSMERVPCPTTEPRQRSSGGGASSLTSSLGGDGAVRRPRTSREEVAHVPCETEGLLLAMKRRLEF